MPLLRSRALAARLIARCVGFHPGRDRCIRHRSPRRQQRADRRIAASLRHRSTQRRTHTNSLGAFGSQHRHRRGSATSPGDRGYRWNSIGDVVDAAGVAGVVCVGAWEAAMTQVKFDRGEALFPLRATGGGGKIKRHLICDATVSPTATTLVCLSRMVHPSTHAHRTHPPALRRFLRKAAG